MVDQRRREKSLSKKREEEEKGFVKILRNSFFPVPYTIGGTDRVFDPSICPHLLDNVIQCRRLPTQNSPIEICRKYFIF